MPIHKIIDTSGSVNNKITCGEKAVIHGEMIKIDGEHPTVGVYFRNKANANSFVRVEMDCVRENGEDVVIIEVPLDLDDKSIWKLEIRTQFDGTEDPMIDAPRVIILDAPLRVRKNRNKRKS